MTGCTSIQITPERKNGLISKIDVPKSIVEAMEAMGHTVDWRKVTPGEDLSGYDAAWVNLAPINSLNGRAGAMGALYTLGSGLPCVGFFDDWQFSAVFNGMRALVRRPEMLTKYLLVGSARGDEAATYFSRAEAYAAYERVLTRTPDAKGKCYVERYYFKDRDEDVVPWAAHLVNVAQSFNQTRWDQGMVPVVPMYAWGDRTGVRKRLPKVFPPVEPLDPSSTIYPLIAPHTPLPPDEKKREWILGALMPHDAWVDKKEWAWPIQYTGAKKMKARGGERLKTESDVIDRYNQVWGILSPPYPHAGSGWWRSRFMYAAKIGSVLVCDKGEGDPLGDAYRYRPAQIEQMSTDDLASVAAAQAAALRPYMPTPESFVNHVEHIIQRAVREDKGFRA